MKPDPHPRMRVPRDHYTEPADLRDDIQRVLEEPTFPEHAYRDPHHLQTLLEAGFDVAALATAFDVSKRAIYNYVNEYDLKDSQPPSTGPARELWEMSVDEFDHTIMADGGSR